MNIKDIARLAGVSPTTVSKILNRKDQNISSQTRAVVLDTIKKYHYTLMHVLPRNETHGL